MAGRRSASGFVSVIAALAVSAVSLVAIVGRGNASSVIDLLHGGAWVSSQAGDRPRLHHVNANGKVDFSALTDSADPMRMANTEGRALAVNTGTGLVTVVDLSKAAAQASSPVDDGRALLPVGAAGHLYLVDPGQGTVRSVAAGGGPGPLVSDPVEVRPGARDRGLSDRPGVDDAGTLWVSAVPDGMVVPVTSERADASTGTVPPPTVGRPVQVAAGTDRPRGIEVSIVSGDAYVLVRYADHAEVGQLRTGQSPRLLATRPGQPLPPDVRVAPRQGDSDVVNLLDPTARVVRRVHPDRGELDSVAVPGARRDDVQAPVTAGGKLIFVDVTTGALVAADPDRPGSQPVAHALAAPGTPIELVVKDGSVVANDPRGNRIVTYGRDGTPIESEKFVNAPTVSDVVNKPVTPPPAKKPKPAPAPGPTPNPAPVPAGPPAQGRPVATTPTTAALRPPGEPGNLRAVGGAGQVVLAWQASTAGGASTGFVLTAPDGSTTAARAGELQKTVPSPNGKAATFTIRAENPAGRSRDVPFPSATAQSQVPGPPTSPKAAPADGMIAVSWIPPPANGTTIQGYRVTAADGSTLDVPASGAAAVLTPLTNGQDYGPITISALARTTSGAAVVGQPATISGPAIPFGKPPAPTGVTMAPTANSGALIVSVPQVAANGDPATLYEYTLNPGGQTARANPTVGPVQYTYTGITNGTQYSVTVTATNRAGRGPPSSPVSATPRAEPSVSKGAWSQTATSVRLAFSVAGNGETPDSCWYTLDFSTTKNPISCTLGTLEVTGLKPSTDYHLGIQAHNSAGNSAEAGINFRTDAAPPTRYYETVASNPVPTKTWRQTNASGPGPDIKQGTRVEVACRKKDGTITSNSGGWWYKLLSSPWDGFWAPAGDFFNGGASWDPDVPVC